MKRLEGKIAVVTASTDGVGFAIARRFAQEGAKVVISSRNQKNVDAAVAKLKSEGLHVTGLVCHVANADDRRKVFQEAEKLGGLDILVSNAAVNPRSGPVLSCSESAWDKLFEVNVKASFLLAKEALPLIRKRGSGRIIFIASVAAFLPANLLGAYAVSKTALLGLTKSASAELAYENITVNCIAPGLIDTNFAQFLTKNESVHNQILATIPMHRMGVPDDISGVAAFLASGDASYITGETIVAAGGVASRL